jgi:hypothetical protein
MLKFLVKLGIICIIMPERESQIEKFNRRLKLTREEVEKNLKGNNDEVAQATDKIKDINRTLSYLPLPSEPGDGTTAQDSKRKRRGRR